MELNQKYIIVYCLLILLLLFPHINHSEIIIDSSIAKEENIPLTKSEYKITQEYGSKVGNNLFYSFKSLNIDIGEKANFIVNNSITNIISRVTGGKPSLINGKISSTIEGTNDISNSNLYLLNPFGLLFGEHASLEIGGSFHVSTANYLCLGNDGFFNTKISNNDVLTTSTPSAFGFIDDQKFGLIKFNSISNKDNVGEIKVLNGKTLSIIGGDIIVDNYKLTAYEGKINMVSVNSCEKIFPTFSGLDISPFQKSGFIEILNNSIIDVSSKTKSQGDIYIRSGEFYLNDSKLKAWSKSNYSDNIIDIDVRNMYAAGNSKIDCQTTNSKGSNIQIKAEEDVQFFDNSIIDMRIFSNGYGGDLVINANNIKFIDCSKIYQQSRDGIDHGKISLNAYETVRFSGHDKYNYSEISTSNFSKNSKDTSSIYITGKKIVFENGSGINTQTSGEGSGGDVYLRAYDEVIFNNFNSRIITTTFENDNTAGNVTIKAEKATFLNSGGILATSRGIGDGGDILLDVQELRLYNNSYISSESKLSNENAGNAGNISIGVNNSCNIIHIEDSKITTETQNADGGNVFINVNNMFDMSESKITSSVKGGTGNGGNISIKDPDFVILKNSYLNANAFGGNGGNIRIVTGSLIQSSNSMISASSEKGIDGNIELITPVADFTGLQSLPQNYEDASKLLKSRCSERFGQKRSSLIFEDREGLSESPYDWLDSPLYLSMRMKQQSNKYIKKALDLHQKGKFKDAIILWNHILEKNDFKNKKIYVNCIIALAKAYQSSGLLKKALNTLETRLELIQMSNDTCNKALFYSKLGDIHLLFGNKKQATKYINEADNIADNIKDILIKAIIKNRKGNFYAVYKYYSEAEKSYNECLKLIDNNYDMLSMQIKTMINFIHLAIVNKSFSENNINNIAKIFDIIKHLPDVYDKYFNLISLSSISLSIIDNKKKYEQRLIPTIKKILEYTKIGTKKIQDYTLSSYANGCMGQCYKYDRNNFKEAFKYFHKAIINLNSVYRPEIMYLWHWELGQLYKIQGKNNNAITSYKQAVKMLNKLTAYFHVGNRGKTDIFYKRIRPVFFELAELYLNKAKDLKINSVINKAVYDKTMTYAINNIEMIRTLELQNYYQDECIVETMKNINKLRHPPPNTAIIYTVPLFDRLILLVSFPDSFQQKTVSKKLSFFRKKIRQLNLKLQDIEDDDSYKRISRNLYELLISPIEDQLQKYSINTLIFVPDSFFRDIPFATLFDGEKHLIEKYCIANITAASLTNLNKKKNKIDYNVIFAGLAKEAKPELENVCIEYNYMKAMINNIVGLIDSNFTQYNLINEFKKKSFSIVHIATHGTFYGDPDDTNLQAFKSEIKVEDIKKLITYYNLNEEHQVELLTFSACETAKGDEFATLGLGGIAVKAGAKSSLATLWKIDDKVSSLIFKEFYKQLIVDKNSKAMALQAAQNAIRKRKEYKHPVYWAPFVLIGNWL